MDSGYRYFPHRQTQPVFNRLIYLVKAANAVSLQFQFSMVLVVTSTAFVKNQPK